VSKFACYGYLPLGLKIFTVPGKAMHVTVTNVEGCQVGLAGVYMLLYLMQRGVKCAWVYRGADKSLARQGRNKLQRQKILSFIYPIYNHNWRNISTIYIYITRLTSKEIF
jgi:hypothetical protein